MNFYNSISAIELEKYADEAGLGIKNPIDLVQIEKLIPANSEILEVGCGTGRLGLHLAKKFNYTGIDSNQEYLDAFKKKLENSELRASIINIDILKFAEGKYDAIIFPWTVIGDFAESEQENILKRAKNMLKPNGKIILDNPAKGTTYNQVAGYNPTKFFYDDWLDRFKSIGFSTCEKQTYTTSNGRVRELSVLIS